MADSPQNQPVDPDAPTDKVIKHAFAQIPTWEEWLRQNKFKQGKEDKYAWSDTEWNRSWPSQGRGWMLKVNPERNVIMVDVYNNWLRWGRSLGIKFFVNEVTLPSVLGQIIKEIERNVSDQTRKRRIRMIHANTPDAKRYEPDERPVNGPVMTPDNMQQLRNLGLMQQEAGPIRRPIPDDPDELNREQFKQMINRLDIPCFPKGQRVRIRTPRHTRLNGEMGTVVDAGPNSCYVAIDSYVEANDPDPFRFEAHELEAIHEGVVPDEDMPDSYLPSLDYVQMLPKLGFTMHNDAMGLAYAKGIDFAGRTDAIIHFEVKPYPNAVDPDSVFIEVSFAKNEGTGSRIEKIQHIVTTGMDVVRVIRELEQMAATSKTVHEFADKLRRRNYMGGPIAKSDDLRYAFKESEDLDNPEGYLKALDYVPALKDMGYRLINGSYSSSTLLGTQHAGYLRVKVHPRAVGIVVDIDYQSQGEMEKIAQIKADAIEAVDILREIEQMALDADGITAFTHKLRERNFPNSIVTTQEDHLYYLFGESAMEPDDVDDPMPYFRELQRHAEILGVFREYGVKVRRKMAADRPYYELFWIPNAVTEVTYDLFLQPDGDSWKVTAQGEKMFDDDRGNQWPESFEIGDSWSFAGNLSPDDLRNEVDNILHALSEHRGPEWPEDNERDFDDIDENVDDEIGDYEAYAKGSANWNPVMLLTSKDVRKMIRDAGFRVNTCYRSRVTHGWVTTSTPATDEVFRLMREKPHAVTEYLKDHIRQELIKRFPNLSGQTPQGINMDVFDQRIHLSVWQWSGQTSANPDDPHNYVMYADIQPADYMKRRRGGKMLGEASAASRYRVRRKDGTVYDIIVTKNVTVGQPHPLTGKTEKPFRISFFENGHAILHEDYESMAAAQAAAQWYYNAELKDGAVAVTESEEDPDEIKDLTAYAKGASDPVKLLEEFGYVYSEFHGSRRWNKFWNLPKPLVVNAGRPNWELKYTQLWGSPDIHGQYVYGLIDPEHVNAKATNYIIVQPLNRAVIGGDYDIVTSMRRVLLQVENLARTIPADLSFDQTRLWLYAAMEKIKENVNKQAQATWNESLPVPDPDDPEAFLKRTRHANMGDVVDVVCPSCGDKRQLFKNWPDNVEGWGSKCEVCDAFIPLTQHVVEAEALPTPPPEDEPAAVIATHKPHVYALYGEYANYRSAVSFGTYTSLSEAVAQALSRQLHDEYDYVWAEECKLDSLEDWDTAKVKVVHFTGIKYIINSDGTTKRVEMPPEKYGNLYNTPPHHVRENEDDDIDPASYATQTFHPTRFLEAHGWKKLKVEAYEYWGKDYPLPRPYYLGGMEFTHLRAIIGFDERFRGHFSCSVNIYWNDATGHGFPVKGWNLEPQLIYPQLPGAEDISDKELDYNMPLRRFATGIDKVIENAFLPETDSALHANTHLEAAVGRFVKELNQRADTPIYPQRPMDEARIPNVDDPETFVRNYAKGRFFVAGRSDENKTHHWYWHYGIPSWRWSCGLPDWQSAKEYAEALSIARNLRGKHVRYPILDGPLITEVFLVPEKGGDFIGVA